MKIKAVYDSGSNVTLINQRIVDILKSSLIKHTNALQTMNGLNFSSARANIMLKIGKIEKKLNTFVVKNNEFSYDLLLGLDAISKFNLIQDENLQVFQRNDKNNIVKIEQKNGTLNNPSEDKKTYMNKFQKNTVNSNSHKHEINYNEPIDSTLFKPDLNHIEDKHKKTQILKLIKKYKNIFAIDKFDVGIVRSKKKAEIKLIKDEYVNSRPYKCSIPDEREIKTQIKKLLEANLIEESESAFASPVTLAYKKEDGGKTRLCIDFRKLNSLIVPECYPFPTINDIIDKIPNCKYFTVIDINSAFWSIPLKESDQEKTSFITKFGKFMFKVLPFGLKNAPAIFQRTLSNIIRRNGLDESCINYIDDILIFSKTWEEHIKHIEELLDIMNKEGFKIKLSKCKFASKSVKYLGHFIQENKISPAQENLDAIKKLKRPTDKSGVRSILGSINFYLKYIQNSAEKFEPLHKLLKKNVEFNWTNECEESFNLIKKYLCSSPILSIYDINKEVFIETDASFKGLGAALKQPQTDGKLHPVAYFSRKLSDKEKKMDIIHLECKAIKEALKYWQYYLIGREFTVCSDHKPLENLKTKSRTDEILGDLVHYLSQFNFKIIYRKGKDNILADLLSRQPVLEYFENEDELKVVNLIEIREILHDQRINNKELESAKKTEKCNNITFKRLKGRARIFVSTDFGIRLIKLVHEYYGHIGVVQMRNKIRPFYYFKNLDKLINKYCKNCSICRENKSRRSRIIGSMSKLGPAKHPFEIMSIDSVGGFGGNRTPKKFMHILVDHFTRYAWISTSVGQSAKDFIKLIDSITQKNRIKIILADQYASLNSRELKSYLDKLNIQLVFTSIDCPQSNGLNERLNQTLVNRIRCKINSGDKRAWSRIAEECVVEYNRTIHSSTKYEPAYLLFGKISPISPIADTQQKNLNKDRKEAFQNSMKSFHINKSRIDKNRTIHEFKIGDLVYVENGNRLNRKKTDKVRLGPYKIKGKISSSIYEIDCGKRKKFSNRFHSSKLSPYPEDKVT